MSVQEYVKNKKYRIVVPIAYNGSKRETHTEMFYGGKREAMAREAEIKAQINNHTYVNKNKLTVEGYFKEWLAYCKPLWSPKSYTSNVHWVDNIIAYLGHIQLQDLTAKNLEDFYTHLRNDTQYAEKTIQHHYTLISTALNKAVVWGYITVNVNSRIEKPKVHKKMIECYTPEEVEQLIEVLQNEPLKYQAIILLALDSGARRGELTGLTWEDVDLKKGTININKSTQYTKDLGIFEKTTKTDTSNRILYIAPSTTEILKQYKLEQTERKIMLGSKWENSKRVFITDYGADMHPDTPSRIFSNIIKKYNLKRIKFHALRHTSISLQISNGVQAQVISKRAGHSNVTVTHSIYSHFFDDEFKNVANTMENILKPIRSGIK